MSSNARRNERRREQEAEYEVEQQQRAERAHELANTSTRMLLMETYGYDETDPKVVFFTRLLDHLDKLGIDTYDI